MTPQERLIVLIDLITIKVIGFQNFGEPGADRYDFQELRLQTGPQLEPAFPRIQSLLIDHFVHLIFKNIFFTGPFLS